MEQELLRMLNQGVLQTFPIAYCQSQETRDLALTDDIRLSWEYRLEGLGGSIFRERSVHCLVLFEQDKASLAIWFRLDVEQYGEKMQGTKESRREKF